MKLSNHNENTLKLKKKSFFDTKELVYLTINLNMFALTFTLFLKTKNEI